jgi:hypothetical protein
MPAEITFLATIGDDGDTARAAPSRPTVVCSVEQAFDVIDSLPEGKRRLPRWREARKALRRLRDNPDNSGLAKSAAADFRAALLAEGWFD